MREAIPEDFGAGKLLKAINVISLTSIPKCLANVTEFRPIACVVRYTNV